MKPIFLVFGITAILINTSIGLIFDSYQIFNWLLANLLILFNTILLLIVSKSKINDAYKISLNLLFLFLGVISFFFSIKMESEIKNNYYFTTILIISMIQLLIFFTIKLFKRFS